MSILTVLDKARELGKELSTSEELLTMRDAEARMLQNPEAQEIIKEFNEKQQFFRALQSQGQPLTDSQKKEAEDLETKMLDNPYIYNFFKSQQTFEKMLEEVNIIIGEAIGGGSGCNCGSDCDSGSCDCEGCN